MNPFVKWVGGKRDEIKHFEKHFPKKYTTYVEPFVGGGSVFFHISPKKSVLNDIHKELIQIYRAIRDGYAHEIIKFMKEHPNDKATYESVRALEPKDWIESACKFYYLRKTCYRGMMRYNQKGGFNVAFGNYKNIKYDELYDDSYRELLEGSRLFSRDFEFIFKLCDKEDNFIFIDPPYDSTFTDYGYCSFGKDEHLQLAKLFKASKAKCLMVIGKTPFIEELYKDYIVDEYQKNYRFKLHSGRVGNEINSIHLVIKNY